jgi:hypothetical protein
MTNIVKIKIKKSKNQKNQKNFIFLIIFVLHCVTGLYVNYVILNLYK